MNSLLPVINITPFLPFLFRFIFPPFSSTPKDDLPCRRPTLTLTIHHERLLLQRLPSPTTSPTRADRDPETRHGRTQGGLSLSHCVLTHPCGPSCLFGVPLCLGRQSRCALRLVPASASRGPASPPPPWRAVAQETVLCTRTTENAIRGRDSCQQKERLVDVDLLALWCFLSPPNDDDDALLNIGCTVHLQDDHLLSRQNWGSLKKAAWAFQDQQCYCATQIIRVPVFGNHPSLVSRISRVSL